MVDHPGSRIFLKFLNNAPYLTGKKVVVGIKQSDDLPVSMLESKVECRRLAAIRLVDILHPPAVFPYAVRRVICRAIVNHEDFHPSHWEILREDTVYGLFYESAIVVRVDEDGD